MPKYHPGPLNSLGDIPEKVYSAELKPTVILYVKDTQHAKWNGSETPSLCVRTSAASLSSAFQRPSSRHSEAKESFHCKCIIT